MAGNGKTTEGVQKMELACAALLSGNFSSRNVSDEILVALRDAVFEIEVDSKNMETKEPTEEKPAHELSSAQKRLKEIQDQVRPYIGTMDDPRCGELIHKCLLNVGFASESWMTPEIVANVRNVVGKAPYMRYYAQLFTKHPAGDPLPDVSNKGVRLVMWSLLCKLGSVMMSHRLAHHGKIIAAEKIEEILLNNEHIKVGHSIVAVIATDERATSQVNLKSSAQKCYREIRDFITRLVSPTPGQP